MPDLKEAAKNAIKEYQQKLEENGFIVSGIDEKQYNFEFDITQNRERLKLLVYFGKKGVKPVLQGNNSSEFYKKVFETLFWGNLFDNKEPDEPEKYIGTDESGKGDYFGPLVVSGVAVDKDILVKLKMLGVRDSKLIGDNEINVLSKKIINEVKNFNIVVINPKRYNSLYINFKNVNKILGWGHAKVIENILENTDTGFAISDKFGDDAYIKDELKKKNKQIELKQVHKAEKYTAVAAASILARAKFNEWFYFQKRKNNLVFPKGASKIVDDFAREFVKKIGNSELENYAKVHFKTTKKLLNN